MEFPVPTFVQQPIGFLCIKELFAIFLMNSEALEECGLVLQDLNDEYSSQMLCLQTILFLSSSFKTKDSKMPRIEPNCSVKLVEYSAEEKERYELNFAAGVDVESVPLPFLPYALRRVFPAIRVEPYRGYRTSRKIPLTETVQRIKDVRAKTENLIHYMNSIITHLLDVASHLRALGYNPPLPLKRGYVVRCYAAPFEAKWSLVNDWAVGLDTAGIVANDMRPSSNVLSKKCQDAVRYADEYVRLGKRRSFEKMLESMKPSDGRAVMGLSSEVMTLASAHFHKIRLAFALNGHKESNYVLIRARERALSNDVINFNLASMHVTLSKRYNSKDREKNINVRDFFK